MWVLLMKDYNEGLCTDCSHEERFAHNNRHENMSDGGKDVLRALRGPLLLLVQIKL